MGNNYILTLSKYETEIDGEFTSVIKPIGDIQEVILNNWVGKFSLEIAQKYIDDFYPGNLVLNIKPVDVIIKNKISSGNIIKSEDMSRYSIQEIEKRLTDQLHELLRSGNQEGGLIDLSYNPETEQCTAVFTVTIIEDDDYIAFAGY